MVSAGHGSGIVSRAANGLWMSVVRGMRGVCGMCMCLDRGDWNGYSGELDKLIEL